VCAVEKVHLTRVFRDMTCSGLVTEFHCLLLLYTQKVADILQRIRTALLNADIAQSIKSRGSGSNSPQSRTSSLFSPDPKTSAGVRALCGGTRAVEGPWGDATLDVHRYVPPPY
jgi:hypothetical protein